MNRDAAQLMAAAKAAAPYTTRTVVDDAGVTWSFWALASPVGSWWATDGRRFVRVAKTGELLQDQTGATLADLAHRWQGEPKRSPSVADDFLGRYAEPKTYATRSGAIEYLKVTWKNLQ